LAIRQWLEKISCPIRWTRLAHASYPRLLQAIALVALIAEWQNPRVSSGEPAQYAAAAHGAQGHHPSRLRTEPASHVDRVGFAWPVEGSITSRFGPRGLWGWHRGVDIKAPRGAPIRAAATGTVVFSGRQSSYGRVIKIAHANGLTTIYAHNSANFVKAGDRVKAGALIGAVGRTGHATTNHLHFEVRRQGVARDPLPLLRRSEPGPQDRSRIVREKGRHHLRHEPPSSSS
jgi:murein DD-endopeptidase MepM/ murein hydrolase activator NlpD